MKSLVKFLVAGMLVIGLSACEDFSSCKDGKSVDWSLNVNGSSSDLTSAITYQGWDMDADYHVTTAVWHFTNVCSDGLIYFEATAELALLTLLDNIKIELRTGESIFPMYRLVKYGKGSNYYWSNYFGRPEKGLSEGAFRIFLEIHNGSTGSPVEDMLRDVLKSLVINVSYDTKN